MSEPDSITKTITTYSLDGETWTTKRPQMCKIFYTREVPQPAVGPISKGETDTIPMELLEAYVELQRAAEQLRKTHRALDGTFYTKSVYEGAQLLLDEAIAKVIRAGGGK